MLKTQVKRIVCAALALTLVLAVCPVNAAAEGELYGELATAGISQTIDAGHDHFAAIKEDGSLWTWGNNDCGQLGNGTKKASSVPVKVMDHVVYVSCCYSITAAIQEDGSLWVWGSGNLGLPGITQPFNDTVRTKPVKIMDDVVAVSSGPCMAAIKKDGSLWGWGDNTYGQLGYGVGKANEYGVLYQATPVKLMDNVASVRTEWGCTVVTKTDGRVVVLGDKEYCGEYIDPLDLLNDYLDWGGYRKQYPQLNSLVSAAYGLTFYLGLCADGSLWFCGSNPLYYLGILDVDITDDGSPVKIMDGVRLPGRAPVREELKISTDNLRSGVQYVPYSAMLLASEEDASFHVSSGSLPGGMSLSPYGELSGVPTRAGRFTFTIEASCGGRTASRSFTLTILDCTKENVADSNIDPTHGCLITKYLGTPDPVSKEPTLYLDTLTESDRCFMSDGLNIYELIAVHLDGKTLTEGMDYERGDGSKLILSLQSLRKLSEGRHVFSVEYSNGFDGIMHCSSQILYIRKTADQTLQNRSYTIQVPQVSGGSVVLSQNSAKAGTAITVKITPDPGYAIRTVTADCLTVKKQEDGLFSFIMPHGNVVLRIVFLPAADIQEETGLPFRDVFPDSWFLDPAIYVYLNEIMNGTADDLFSPDLSCSRGMFVTILHRLEKEPEYTGKAAFKDVPAGSYYATAINWAASKGLVNGTGNNNYSPDDNITREQMAAILRRYESWKGHNTISDYDLSHYRDASEIDDYALEPFKWCLEYGLVLPMSDRQLDPNSPATRAQIAMAIMSAYEFGR